MLPSTEFVLFSDKSGKPKITLKESDIRASYIKVTWSSPVDNGGNPVLDYRVIVSGAANQTLEGVVCTEKLIEKLTPGKSYTVTVSARNSVGYGESDSSSFITKSKGNIFLNLLLPARWRFLHFTIPFYIYEDIYMTWFLSKQSKRQKFTARTNI